ncbi:hypothetical protein Dimus_032753 [Dionaea muscipula]
MAFSKLPSMANRLSSIGLQSWYHTSRRAKQSLYSRISPLGTPTISLKPVLDDWVQRGKKVRIVELQRIIRDLRKHKRFSQALQVSEWMNERNILNFSTTEHAVQLDLIGRVHGFHSAENYFNRLPYQARTGKTYGALLNCYVRQRETDKSLSLFKRMKEMGFASTALPYNDIMCLYTHNNEHDKVPQVLDEMKHNNVLPDNYSYRICINSYGTRSDLKGMELILREMETKPHIAVDWNTYAVVASFYVEAGLTGQAIEALKKAEVRIEQKDGEGYNFLISLYSKLGITDEVLRLWELEKSACKRCLNRDYINMLKSLVRLGELEKAEGLLKEWETSGNIYDFCVPDVVVAAYWRNGLFEKAKAVIKHFAGKGNASSPNRWSCLVEEKALDCIDPADSSDGTIKVGG